MTLSLTNQLVKICPREFVFFDASRRRGDVRVCVSDYTGAPFVYRLKSVSGEWLRDGTLFLHNCQVHIGELVGCYLAMRVAYKTNRTYVAGDHQTVIDMWYKGEETHRCRTDQRLSALVRRCKNIWNRFKRRGGQVLYVNRVDNPSDHMLRGTVTREPMIIDKELWKKA